MKDYRTGVMAFLVVLLLAAVGCGAPKEKKAKAAEWFLGGAEVTVVKTMAEDALITAANAKSGPAFHRHLVRPGATTTWAVRVKNGEAGPIEVELSMIEPPAGWTAKLKKTSVSLDPGKTEYVLMEATPSASLKTGSAAAFEVSAKAGAKTEKITLEAEVTDKHKIYIVSIDSLGPEYLALNAKGNGPGKEGDWLMPNLKALISEGIYYPKHKAHLVSGTDPNHSSLITGAYPGVVGMYSVNVFLFGFDDKGEPIVRITPLDLMYHGPDGKPVSTIYTVIKDPAMGGNPNAFGAFVSGKDWVPEHYLNPQFGVDRIATVMRYPDYVTPLVHKADGAFLRDVIKIQLGAKIKPDDAFLWEDKYSIDQAIEVIDNEDPDVCYVLLGGMDGAGHIFGAAHDLSEWDARNTPDDLGDDVSKINRRANRAGMIETVKAADKELGRFVAYLKARGGLDDAFLVVQSDHDMETNFSAGPRLDRILAQTGYSAKKDYFVFTASQEGALFLRPGQHDPNIIPVIEKALEDYRMKNPLTGEMECPMVVLTREEMKTGIDKVTGERFSPPGELYSEYYIDHPKPGGLMWPDMLLLTKKYYQFPLMGVGLANVGMGALNIPLPHIYLYVGGHCGQSTQSALLMFRGPGVPKGIAPGFDSLSSDMAPTLYRLEGYHQPECVQGRVLAEVAK